MNWNSCLERVKHYIVLSCADSDNGDSAVGPFQAHLIGAVRLDPLPLDGAELYPCWSVPVWCRDGTSDSGGSKAPGG